jgi:hypothetical protein
VKFMWDLWGLSSSRMLGPSPNNPRDAGWLSQSACQAGDDGTAWHQDVSQTRVAGDKLMEETGDELK